MFNEKNVLIPTEKENLDLFRYMDSFKFFDFLQTNSLYFPSARKLEPYDKDEGFIADEEVKYIQDYLYSDKLYDMFEATMRQGKTITYGDYKLTGNRKLDLDIMKSMDNSFDAFKDWIFINCWNIGKYESDLMWKGYTSKNDGIAIKTTLDKLKLANNSSNKEIFCQKISYITEEEVKKPQYRIKEYFEGVPRIYIAIRLLLDKKIFFEGDKELRLIFADIDTLANIDSMAVIAGTDIEKIPAPNDYHKIDFDAKTIINEIILHPNASKEFEENIKNKLLMLGYEDLVSKVVKSKLSR